MYPWLKLLHVAGVVLFLGNIITGLFWHAHAARTRDPRLLAHAMDGIIRADRIFTGPSVLLIAASGFAAAASAGFPVLGTGWILWSLVLFTLSGVVFMVRVAPLQRQLRSLAASGVAAGDFDWERYRRLAIAWELWGAFALVTPAAALALMVLKPRL
jgi:uncharacterized membrane protein